MANIKKPASPPPNDEDIIATTIEELPSEIRTFVNRSGVPAAKIYEHWDVFCTIIHFVCKKRILREPRKPHIHKSSSDDLPHPGNPKKLFKAMVGEGKGGFGSVFSATSPEKQRVAVKRVPHKNARDKKRNFEEVAFLYACRHPNIVKYFCTYESKDDSDLWIVMELLEGGTLDQALHNASSFTEKHIAFTARDIVQGLWYLHARKIAHRDMKAPNVMMSFNSSIKIIDFGLAVDMSNGPKNEMAGSPFWMPPEMILHQPHSFPCDIWSMGICILGLANQKPPTSESPLKVMFSAAVLNPPILDKPERWSADMQDFVARCVVQDPTKRATADELLRHPFMRQSASEAEMKTLLKEVFITSRLGDTTALF